MCTMRALHCSRQRVLKQNMHFNGVAFSLLGSGDVASLRRGLVLLILT